MTDLRLFRVYEPHELGEDGYPLVWHKLAPERVIEALKAEADIALTVPDGWHGPVKAGVKDLVRALAFDRCLRCGHPYRVGESIYEAGAPDDTITRHPTHELLAFVVDAVEPPKPGAMQRGISWSPCDERCTHRGPVRVRWHEQLDGAWVYSEDGVGDEGWYDEVQAAWRILTVHHLNGRKFDLRWWNLAALCQRCHLVIQGKVTMERVYPFEHTPWFQPFAAGFYAASYLGEELTRAQVLDRLPELLALERLV